MSVEKHRSTVEWVDSRQYLHQRRFARSILSDERVDFPPFHFKVAIAERMDSIKALRNASHVQEWHNGRYLISVAH